MPKDNEVDENVVAWMLTRKRDGFIRAIYNVKPTDEQIAIAEYDGDVYVPLAYAATVAELRAEVERLEALLAEGGRRLIDENMRASAAERWVGDLEKLMAAARRAIGDHHAPNDCYATGPLTGDAFLDLAQCPACAFLEQHEALTGADPT